MSKRGQYFTIDAFIALIVISTGLILVIAANSYAPSPNQPEALSQGIVNSFVQTKVNDLNNAFLKEKIVDGTITNPHNTILQQAYEFKTYGTTPPDPDLARNLLINVTPDMVPSQYGFEIRVDNEIYYARPSSLGQDQKDTNLLVSGKRIIFGTNSEKEFWGPVVAEVRVWQ